MHCAPPDNRPARKTQFADTGYLCDDLLGIAITRPSVTIDVAYLRDQEIRMIEASAGLRVGLIGYGFSGKTFHAPLINAVEGLDLQAVASRKGDLVRADLPGVAVENDPARLIARDDLNLVVIATPNDTHAPLARAAIMAGKHVVIDKPLTLDIREARDLIALANQQGVLLSVFHNRRWDSDFLTVRRAIEDGVAGTVSHFESHFDRFRPEVRDRWRERNGPGSGIWFDLGPHLVDQALLLFGLPDYVHVDLAAQRHGAHTDDWVNATLSYGARRVVLHAGSLVAGGTNRFTVHGDAGSIVKRLADQQEAQLLSGMRPGAPAWGTDDDRLACFDTAGEETHIAATPGDQRQYYVGIRDMLANGAASPVRPVEALAVMAIIVAGSESARARAAVPVPLTDGEVQAYLA
jgi:predicted dehydrogenase